MLVHSIHPILCDISINAHLYKDVAELLLAHGAEVNVKDKLGWTPVYTAASYGHKDVAELLRQHGGHE
jgi:ankyrin repeat protein